MSREEVLQEETIGGEHGRAVPVAQEDKEYFTYLRVVFKQYNIVLSKSQRLEYDFMLCVAGNEFYLNVVLDPQLDPQ